MTQRTNPESPPPGDAQAEQLAAAAAAVDWPAIAIALDAGADPNQPVFDGGTVLHLAIYQSEPVRARELLARGASPRAVDEFGRTPLHWVAELATLPAVAELIGPLVAAGADLTAADQRGRTALHAAAIRGATAAVVALLQAGAAVNARKADGMTALHFAVVRNQLAVVDALLAGGADVTLVNARGETPLQLAQKLAHAAMVTRLQPPTRPTAL